MSEPSDRVKPVLVGILRGLLHPKWWGLSRRHQVATLREWALQLHPELTGKWTELDGQDDGWGKSYEAALEALVNERRDYFQGAVKRLASSPTHDSSIRHHLNSDKGVGSVVVLGAGAGGIAILEKLPWPNGTNTFRYGLFDPARVAGGVPMDEPFLLSDEVFNK